RAAALYTGDLFHGFDVSDPSFADWLRGERERLRGIAIHVLERLLARETGQAAISAGRRLLERDPLAEAAHRTLMRRYAEAGETGAALKQYEECRKVLHRELNAKPSSDTESLHRMIRDHSSTGALPRPEPSPITPRQEIMQPTSASKPSIA